MGLLAAHDLALIDDAAFEARATNLLDALARLPLVEGTLPNKAYDTRTLAMVNYDNSPAPNGIGWSTLDIARLAVPLTITAWRHPQFTHKISAVLARWHLERAVKAGRLTGSWRGAKGTLESGAEGRFGYEQYGAKSLFLLGLDVSQSIRYDTQVEVMKVSGQKIAYDARLPRDHGDTHNAVLSEPYLLEAFEFGLDSVTRPLAQAVLGAQRNRYGETGIVTAVSEDNIDRAPYFVYFSVLNDKRPWAAFAPDGSDASAHRAQSFKAAFGWASLFEGAYAELLEGQASGLETDGGFYSGRYEADGQVNKTLTANTNGIILEALWYRVRGPLIPAARQPLELANRAAP
jgi:hypothetical protein